MNTWVASPSGYCEWCCYERGYNPAFISGYISRGGTAVLHGTFNFFRNCHSVFCSGCTIVHCQQQCTRIPVSLHPHQHLIFFLLNNHPNKCELVSPVVLICIFLKISDIEHCFLCLLAICISSLEKCLIKSIVYF